jgi:23S rRNA (pseudouridine1915-N3)-methyltransferase
MKLMIMAVGSPRDRGGASAIRDYESRAGTYFRLETQEVPPASGVGNDPRRIRAREAEDFYRRLPDGLDTWALTREGSAMTSRELANTLGDMATYGHAGAVFVVGGAFGIDEAFVGRCKRSISLSRMTLPLDLARLVLAEQLYRAGTILRGEPYHKGD